MLRLILGIIAGLVVGLVVTATVEGVGHALFPPPPGVNLTDPSSLKTVMAQISPEAKMTVLLAWFLGILAGASTANLVAGRRALAGRLVAAIVFAFAVWTMMAIPHPVWFVISAVIAALLAALAADRAFGRPRA